MVNRFNGNNILDSSPCGLRVDWSYVRVFSWFALRMNHENQTTKSHEPGITKRHKGSADESSMLLPKQEAFVIVETVGFIHILLLKRGVNKRSAVVSFVMSYRVSGRSCQ